MSDIGFCSHQVRWLIESFLDIDSQGSVVCIAYTWPAEDKNTGYTDGVHVQRSIPQRASYERPLQEAAEVHHRLEKTGRDGLLLVSQIHAGKTWPELAWDSKTALLYTSGKKRKVTPYRVWKSKYRTKSNILLPILATRLDK